MLWALNNPNIGGFYKIFPPNTNITIGGGLSDMIFLIPMHFVEATTGVCWRFIVFKLFQREIESN